MHFTDSLPHPVYVYVLLIVVRFKAVLSHPVYVSVYLLVVHFEEFVLVVENSSKIHYSSVNACVIKKSHQALKGNDLKIDPNAKLESSKWRHSDNRKLTRVLIA